MSDGAQSSAGLDSTLVSPMSPPSTALPTPIDASDQSDQSRLPRSHSVAFDESCVVIDTKPLTAAEDGTKGMLPMPAIPSRRSSLRPGKPRLFIPPVLANFLPNPSKIPFFRHLSSSPTSRSTSHSNPKFPPTRSATAPAVPIRCTHTEPLSPCCGRCQASTEKGKEPGWTPPLSDNVEKVMKIRELEVKLGLREKDRFATVMEEPEDGEILGGAGEKVIAVDDVKRQALTSGCVPKSNNFLQPSQYVRSFALSDTALPGSQSGAMRHSFSLPTNRPISCISASSSTSDDHGIISALGNSRPMKMSSSVSTDCHRVWLCSPPPRSPLSPSFSQQDSRNESAITISCAAAEPGKKQRPVVTRSISTGRLATEFDDEGRVICLSVHSERVLRTPRSSAPSCWRDIPKIVSPTLHRAQSCEAAVQPTPVIRDLPVLSTKEAERIRPRRNKTFSELSKMGSKERLVPSLPLPAEKGTGASMGDGKGRPGMGKKMSSGLRGWLGTGNWGS